MSKLKLLVVSASLMILYSHTCAQYIGQMRSAETSGWGSLNLLSAAGIYEDAFTVSGTARYGIASPVDASASFALLDHDQSKDLSFTIGSDIQYRFAHVDLGSPLDMSIGGMIQYFSLRSEVGQRYSDLGIGVNYVVSIPVKTESGFSFTPYGRLQIRVDHQRLRGTTANGFQERGFGNNDSKVNIGFNLGSVFPISSNVSLVGELQLDDQIAFLAGVNFLMW